MPTELRRIVFTNDELRHALAGQRVDGRPVIPFGQIQSARFIGDSRDELMLRIYDHTTDKHHEAVLSSTLIAAALMSYCITQRVPLPRSARKSIAISGDNVALDLRTEGSN